MSSDDLHDDAEFERFLAGEGELSPQLKALAQPEPSAELDAAVFARIEAAMAAEKVQTVEPQPPAAANDPVGPPAVSPQKKHSVAWYWHWPVGVAAGILAVFAYRTAVGPRDAGPSMAALDDKSIQTRVMPRSVAIAPAPDLAAAPPPRMSAVPEVAEPPPIPEPSVAVAPAAAPPAVVALKDAGSPPKEVASAGNSIAGKRIADTAHGTDVGRADVQQVVVTGSNIRRADSETPSAVQVITSSEIKHSGSTNVMDNLSRDEDGTQDSGVAKAWGYDPVQAAHDARVARELQSDRQVASAPAAPLLPQPSPQEMAPVDAPPVQALAVTGGNSVARAAAPAAPVPLSPAPRPSVATDPAAPASADANGYTAALSAQGQARFGVIDAPATDTRPVAPTTSARIALQSSNSPGNGAPDNYVQRPASPLRGEELARKVPEVQSDPRKWLELIQQKLNHKDKEAALAEWDNFSMAYPSYHVPSKLRNEIKALRTRKQPAAPANPAASNPAR